MTQKKSATRSNAQRTEETRARLIACARKFFVKKGFAETGTPEIVKAARVTRGALYHHFTDKTDLFRAVLIRESRAIRDEIHTKTAGSTSPLDAMMRGTDAYFNAMATPGRARLLLLDGPAVLGHDTIQAFEHADGQSELQAGLEYAMRKNVLPDVPVAPLADILSAAFDRAALAIINGENVESYKVAIRVILESLVHDNQAA